MTKHIIPAIIGALFCLGAITAVAVIVERIIAALSEIGP